MRGNRRRRLTIEEGETRHAARNHFTRSSGIAAPLKRDVDRFSVGDCISPGEVGWQRRPLELL